MYNCGQKSFVKTIKDGSGNDMSLYRVTGYETRSISRIAKDEGLSELETIYKYYESIHTTENAQTSIRTRVQEATDSEDNMYALEYYPVTGRNRGKLTELLFVGPQKRLVSWFKNVTSKSGGKIVKREKVGTFWDDLNWNNVTREGGVRFRYFRLAPSLLKEDQWGNWVISKEYNGAMLAEALCKLEGFTYEPSDAVYWKHGHSTERDFLYTTTAQLNHEQLEQLSDEVGGQRTLLVLCAAFRGKADRYPNLTIKKIPKQVLSRCEWGHDDYSLEVENLPQADRKKGQQTLFAEVEEQ
jgi:hypothetical protein